MDSGNMAWVLISAALVLFMIPGLAFFYGGMDRSRNVLNMLMMNFYCVLIIPILWVVVGYSLAQTPFDNSFIGGFDSFFLKDITAAGDGMSLATIAFLGMFAAITPALISGAVADRMKFSAWAIFVPIWFLLVYVPIFKWVYGGWLGQRGSIDFAGGTAIHVNAGIAALAAVLVLGKRRTSPTPPHSMPLVMIGTGILWFGWFGFNAGSALGANGIAGLAFLNTQVAAAAALIGWIFVEKVRNGHATTLGAASGAVAGLVAITPACAFVAPWAAVVIGFLAGVICSIAVGMKYLFNFDDSLDVVGVHLVGGIWGSLSIGLFGSSAVNSIGLDGLLFGGGTALLGKQALAVALVAGYSFLATLIIGFAIEKTIGFRVTKESELEGVDFNEHAESAYEMSGSTRGGSLI